MQRSLPRLAVLGPLLFATAAAAVEPGAVYSPRVEQGEREVEYRAFSVRDRRGDENGLWNHHVAFGYGVNSVWWTEVVGEYERPRGGGGGWQAFEWENRFQLTEPGEYWVDVGALVEIEKARRGNGAEVKLGLLLEKDIDDVTVTANWIAVRERGDEASSRWGQEYRAQLRWRYDPLLQPLVEVQADTRSMNAGPGLYGSVKLGRQKLVYTLAWLLRTHGDTPKQLPRIALELEF